jgi:hypothetical protein
MQKENINQNQPQEFDHINTLIENLNYEEAKNQLLIKLKQDPNNIEILDIISEVLFNLDEIEDAKQVISYNPRRIKNRYN